MSAEFDPVRMLRVLNTRGVRYVVIGGFAAWVHGAPMVTVDLDIVYEASEQNITQLCQALKELQAIYQHPFGRRLEPTAAGLSSTQGAGHHLLSTSAGDLDILSLPRIIELKQAAGRSKDLAALPMLRAVLESAAPNE